MKQPLLLSLIAAGLAVATPAQADNDLCRNVSFKFTNDHESRRKIKVVEVQYHNVVNDRSPTVDVVDVECNYGATCATPGIDLQDVEGNPIKDIKFVYRYVEADGDWADRSSRGAGPFDPPKGDCRANRSYGPFAITGRLQVTGSVPATGPQIGSSVPR